MNNKWFCYAGIVFFIFGIVSCANVELKKQGEATRDVGEVYLLQGDYTAALNELLKAEKMNPDDPHLHNDLGLVYVAKDQIPTAIEHFKKAIDLKPDYAPARNNLGTAYLAMKDWDSAITCFKQVSKDLLYATPHYPLSNLGWAYYNKKEYAPAEQYYREALKIEPNFPIALRGLGLTFIASGNPREAVNYFERAAKYSAFPELFSDLAGAYMILKEYNKALLSYKKVVDIAPESQLAADARKEIERIQKEHVK
ncbi:MAG: Tetratricopeptide repeat protein [Thermodesulfobacteriota bacterium]|nr:Tetratricopeptide repeat protein [Thermodesulfobacteriota bacterium]